MPGRDRDDREAEQAGRPRSIAGASTKTARSANGGIQSSLQISLIVSATVCSRPNGPTRFGSVALLDQRQQPALDPDQQCRRATARRSGRRTTLSEGADRVSLTASCTSPVAGSASQRQTGQPDRQRRRCPRGSAGSTVTGNRSVSPLIHDLDGAVGARAQPLGVLGAEHRRRARWRARPPRASARAPRSRRSAARRRSARCPTRLRSPLDAPRGRRRRRGQDRRGPPARAGGRPARRRAARRPTSSWNLLSDCTEFQRGAPEERQRAGAGAEVDRLPFHRERRTASRDRSAAPARARSGWRGIAVRPL